MKKNKRKIILDTDIADDIDDAFALALALKDKRVDLLGVTTVFWNADARAQFAKYFLSEFGAHSIPVRAGASKPFLQIPEKIEPPQFKIKYDEKGRYLPPQYDKEQMDCTISSEHASNFIVNTFKSEPDCEIVTIGALTNLALAIKLAPDVFVGRKCTIMGGCYNKLNLGKNGAPIEIAEWNILCDPEAAQIVFSSGMQIYMVGLDVTLDVEMPKNIFDKVLDNPPCKSFPVWIEKWKKHVHCEIPCLHDPLALASCLDDKILQFESHKLYVVTDSKGQGFIRESETANNINVALKLNKDYFWQQFENIFLEEKQ